MPKTKTIAVIEGLRTVRRNQFSAKAISDANFAAILEAAVCAANASNRQSYALIAVDKAVQAKLNWPGDRTVVFCVDFTRLARLAEAVGVPCSLDHFQPFLTGVIDTALVVQTAVIAAKSLGIDSRITNDAFLADRDAIYRELHLPTGAVSPWPQSPSAIQGRNRPSRGAPARQGCDLPRRLQAADGGRGGRRDSAI